VASCVAAPVLAHVRPTRLVTLHCARAFVAVLSLLALACGDRKAAPPPPPPLALPPLDRAWTIDDLAAAAVELDAVCTSAPLRLPTYGTAAFARLVGPELHDEVPAQPLEARQAELKRLDDAWLALYGTYLRCGRPTETLAANAALLEGYAASLQVGAALRDAAAAGSPQRAQREQGLAIMADGLRGGVGSTVGMLLDPGLPASPPEVAARLGAAIARVAAALPPGALDESLAALRAGAAAATEPARREMLAAAVAAL
jgi:hypothetical protein